MKISIVIPILNEEINIKNTLQMLNTLEGDKEIIFVDGGSTDGTKALIPAVYKCLDSKRGRACQMNMGGAAATGEILWFLHCDSLIPGDALKYIEATIDQGCAGGCFSLQFDKRHWLLGMIAALSNLRVKLLKIMFGDQGIFIRKDVFFQIGGFPEIPIMEDLEFSRRLKGLGPFRQIPQRIVTSARRFEKGGILRTILFMHKLKLLYFMGKSPEELSKLYKNMR